MSFSLKAFDEWRVITTKADEITVKVEDNEDGLQVIDEVNYEHRPLDFDYNKHKLLNSELKKLYTAITRARVNVWIFDEDKKRRAPMFDFLVKKKLVDVAKLKDGEVRSSFAEQSSRDEWEKRGNYFFSKGLWKLAMKCADKANNPTLKEKCSAKMSFELAYKLAREENEQKRGGKRALATVHNQFKVCALHFLKCGLLVDAEISLRNAKDYFTLALLYEKQRKVQKLECLYFFFFCNVTFDVI